MNPDSFPTGFQDDRPGIPVMDQRPKKGLWAPGKYLGTCGYCGQRFIGDKRAYSCAPCVYGDSPENPITGSAKAPLTAGVPLHASQDPKGPVAAVAQAKTGTPEGRLTLAAEQVQAFIDGESPDSNVEKVRELLLQRSLEGLKKYGCTTDKAGLSELQWHQHHLEELLDAAVYVMQKISDLEGKA